MQLSTSRRQCIKGSDAKNSLSILEAPGWLTDSKQVTVRSAHPTRTALHERLVFNYPDYDPLIALAEIALDQPNILNTFCLREL